MKKIRVKIYFINALLTVLIYFEYRLADVIVPAAYNDFNEARKHKMINPNQNAAISFVKGRVHSDSLVYNSTDSQFQDVNGAFISSNQYLREKHWELKSILRRIDIAQGKGQDITNQLKLLNQKSDEYESTKESIKQGIIENTHSSNEIQSLKKEIQDFKDELKIKNRLLQDSTGC